MRSRCQTTKPDCRTEPRLVARCIGAGSDLVNVDGRWPVAYGVNSSGAVLVCPDGLVCWRAEERGEQLEQTLEAVLATWPDNTKGSAFGASAGVAPAENGEMSQNTVLAGLLSRDTQMRQFAGDIP